MVKILNTIDGGINWVIQKQTSSYMRSIEFSSTKRGFAGGLEFSGNNVFYKTLDGGVTWTDISSVITGTNRGICGICSVDTNNTYAVGVWSSPAYVLKTTDGGNTWAQINMSAYANSLVDVEFKDPLNGYVTGQSNIPSEGAVILKTTNGGVTWSKVYTSGRPSEYVWKIQNLDNKHWYASVEKAISGWNVTLKSLDGGNTWLSQNIVFDASSDYFQVVGFLDSLKGWTGGKKLFQTTDGGITWIKVDSILNSHFDRFEKVNSNSAYITGTSVYKLQSGWADINVEGKPEVSRLPSLNVFPNPTKGSFTIELIIPTKTMYNLRIISLTGSSIIWNEVGQKEKGGKYEFRINQKLTIGEYFVYVMTNEGATSKKIIILD